MSRYSLVCAGFVAVALVAPHAQTPARPAPVMMSSVDPALFKGLQYRLVGPSRGGRVTTVTGVPSQPRTFYMGVASGGLFRTTDSGATWAPITDGKVPARIDGLRRGRRLRSERDLPRHRIGRRAQQRLDRPRHLQDDRRRRDVEVHRASTTPVRSAPCAFIRPIRTSCGSPRRATRSRRTAERGIFKTTDGGATWKKVLFVSDNDRRDGRRAAAWPSGRRLCLDVAARAQAVDDHQRRRRDGGLLQEHGRRRALHEDRRRACRPS